MRTIFFTLLNSLLVVPTVYFMSSFWPCKHKRSIDTTIEQHVSGCCSFEQRNKKRGCRASLVLLNGELCPMVFCAVGFNGLMLRKVRFFRSFAWEIRNFKSRFYVLLILLREHQNTLL